MNTVIVDKADISLTHKNSGIMIDSQHIPFHLVGMLVLTCGIAVDTKTFLRLSKENIPVLIVGRNSQDFSLTLPLKSKNSEQKMQQYASLKNRLGYAKYFLGEKITSHHNHLKRIGMVEDPGIWKKKIDASESVAELLGIEGSFAAIYFKHYFKQFPKVLHKGKRSKRPPLDPVNAVLSYVYTYAYHSITAKLHQAGLDPALSYLHEPFRSHNGLSSDFLELYRAQINEKVAEFFLDEVLTTDDFSAKNGVHLKYNGRKKLWPSLKELSSALSVQMDNEIALLRASIS
jgi:CRISPR-associated protein Cas1